jgi:hypothetical protein
LDQLFLLEVIRTILYRDPAALANAFSELGYNSALYLQLVEEIETATGSRSSIRDFYPL